jgi:hypothetical protein
MRCKEFVIDTHIAKQSLIKKYEIALSNVF